MTPEIDVSFEGCIRTPQDTISIVTSMQFFSGPHPTSEEADEFVRSLGFELHYDHSSTLDYINAERSLILRDCHPGNWISTKKTLVPIDIIPERVKGL